MSIYVKKVETNLKSGCNVEIGLKTLIVGVNRSGKSTIVNAIEAALSGRVSDVAGRATLAADHELWTLAPPLCESAFAQVTLSDGVKAQWMLAKGKRAQRAIHRADGSGYAGALVDGSIAGIAFPLRAVRENLAAGPEKARKWLLDTIVTAEWSAAEALIAVAVIAQVKALASGSIAGLPKALEVAKAQGREATRNAEMLRERARGAAAALPPPAAAEVVDEVALKLAEQEEALAAAKARLVTAKAAVVAAQVVVTALPPPPAADFSATGAALLTVLRGQIAAKAVRCVMCSRENPADTYTDRLTAIERHMTVTMQAVAARTKAESAMAVAISTHREVEREIAIRLQAIMGMRTVAATVEPDTRWDDVKRMTGEADEAEKTAATWAKIADEVSHAIGVLVERARVEFEKLVTLGLPVGLVFGLDLTDGDREVARFGLRVNVPSGADGALVSTLRSALSGAEWAMVTCAIASAVVGDVPSIIVPEERAFDPVTLSAALHAFSRFDGQVIVTSPIDPAEIPSGWTVIRTSGVGATVGTAAPAAPPEVPVKRRPGRPRNPARAQEEAERRAAEVARLNEVIAAEETDDPELRGDSITQPALSVAALMEAPVAQPEPARPVHPPGFDPSLWDD